MKKTNSFIVEEFDGLHIVRDDLFEGGTKKRVLAELMDSYTENEFVYATDYYGHAGYAIALSALDASKKTKLFYPSPFKDTAMFRKVTSLPNVTYEIVTTAHTQLEAGIFAEKYATKSSAKFFKIGLDTPEFVEKLSEVVKEVQIIAPEIWCMGGSGALGRALKKAYPTTPVNVVNIGPANATFKNYSGLDAVYIAPEDLDDEATIKPPYPSASHYDAKVWQFFVQHAKKGAYIWNVAG